MTTTIPSEQLPVEPSLEALSLLDVDTEFRKIVDNIGDVLPPERVAELEGVVMGKTSGSEAFWSGSQNW